MGVLCELELHNIERELKTILSKLSNVTPSERHAILFALEDAVELFVDRVDVLNATERVLSAIPSPPLEPDLNSITAASAFGTADRKWFRITLRARLSAVYGTGAKTWRQLLD